MSFCSLVGIVLNTILIFFRVVLFLCVNLFTVVKNAGTPHCKSDWTCFGLLCGVVDMCLKIELNVVGHSNAIWTHQIQIVFHFSIFFFYTHKYLISLRYQSVFNTHLITRTNSSISVCYHFRNCLNNTSTTKLFLMS